MVITKNNFLITLAPYFFPLYVAAVVLFFTVGNWIWDWTPYLVWFHLLMTEEISEFAALTFTHAEKVAVVPGFKELELAASTSAVLPLNVSAAP